MSTELLPISTTRLSDKISLTEFFGGLDRGGCLQLTQFIDGEHRYIQLTRDDSLALAKRLQPWSDKNPGARQWH